MIYQDIKDYSRYKFALHDGGLVVMNKKTGHRLKPVGDRWHTCRKFALRADNGHSRYVSELRIAFALKHGLTLTELGRNRFYGTVDNPICGIRPYRKLETQPTQDEKTNRIMQLEQSLDMMKFAHYTGNYSSFVEFAEAKKDAAVSTVAKRCGFSYTRVNECWDEARDMFIDKIRNAAFTSLKPVFSYLCTCLKYTCLQTSSRKNVPLNDRFLHTIWNEQ